MHNGNTNDSMPKDSSVQRSVDEPADKQYETMCGKRKH